MKKLELLESLRGFAAIYVVLAHIYIFNFPQSQILLFEFNLLSLLDYAQDAVMLFFILSGFVIQYSFMKSEDKSFKLYFFKRFTRIFIPLICVLCLTFTIQYLEGSIRDFSLKILLCNLLMLQDIPWRPGLISTTIFSNYPLWSLSYEFWYYMLFFLLTIKFRKISNSIYIYVFIIMAIISYHFYPMAINRWLLYLAVWWTGRDIAVLYYNKDKILFKNLLLPLCTIALGAIIMKLSQINHGATETGNLTKYEYLNLWHTFIILVIAISWHKIGWKFFNYIFGPFKILAPISYGIYISHMILIVQANYLDFIGNIYIRYFLYLIICLLFSYIIERIVYVKITFWLKSKIFHSK